MRNYGSETHLNHKRNDVARRTQATYTEVSERMNFGSANCEEDIANRTIFEYQETEI
jgi:hypothetical protein